MSKEKDLKQNTEPSSAIAWCFLQIASSGFSKMRWRDDSKKVEGTELVKQKI